LTIYIGYLPGQWDREIVWQVKCYYCGGLFNSIGLGFFIYEKNNNGLRLVIHKICG